MVLDTILIMHVKRITFYLCVLKKKANFKADGVVMDEANQ